MDCKYNDEEIKLYKTCYVMGPTGPTGPMGQIGPTGPEGLASSKISVVSTKTIGPDGEADVYNSGTDNDVLLNFVIPRGATGPVANFIIGSVKTVDSQTPAQVTITPIYKSKGDEN